MSARNSLNLRPILSCHPLFPTFFVSQIQLGGVEKHCNLLQRGPERSPGRKGIRTYFSFKTHFVTTLFSVICVQCNQLCFVDSSSEKNVSTF